MNSLSKWAVLMLCLTFAAISHAADYDFKSDGICYKVMSLDDMTAGVTTGDAKYTGDIVIPSTVTYNGRTFTVTQILGNAFDGTTVTSVKLPETITFIGYRAFNSTSKLTAIELPKTNPLKIGQHAFNYSAIESIVIPDNVTEIGNYAFQQCSSLVSAEIGDGVTEIPIYAFSGSSKLTTVKLGKNIKKIDSGAFSGCSSLAEINLPDGLKSLGTSAFNNCKKLTSIALPAGLEIIEYSTFSGCERLTEIVIPDNVLTVKGGAFYNCTRLKSVSFGSKIENIEKSCIDGCTALTEISIRNPEPPQCKAFENKQYMDITLKVPGSAIDDYKNAEPWKNFWTIEALGATGIQGAAADANITVRQGTILLTREAADGGVQVYDIAGRCVYQGHDTEISSLPSGVYIVKTATAALKARL